MPDLSAIAWGLETYLAMALMLAIGFAIGRYSRDEKPAPSVVIEEQCRTDKKETEKQ